MRENQLSSPILALALQTMLASRLQKTLNSQESILFPSILPNRFAKIVQNLPHVRENNSLKPADSVQIKLKRTYSADSIQYASAVALRLAQSDSDIDLCAAALKHSLFQSIQSIPTPAPRAQIWHRCVVSVDSRGWLYINISDIGLAVWLEALRAAALELDLNQIDRFPNWPAAPCNAALPATNLCSSELFKVIYTHARCCSLLNKYLSGSQSIAPRWLAGSQLCCQHPSERLLIAELCDVLDYLANLPVQHAPATLKMALRLSQAFATFHTSCRLSWPESAAALGEEPDPDLLAVRLGLIVIVQKLLQILLEQRLSIPAPTQL